MQRDLSRLLRPTSIAVIGGAWASNVVKQLQKAGYRGDIWPVHPQRDEIRGVACFSTLDDLPAAPDAAFIGINRELTVAAVQWLAARGGGGAVCFASGFLESEADLAGGAQLQQQLLQAAGDMPVLGPNCYGLVNYLDNIPLWPDEHGGVPVARGVAIIAQSSNIAISISMQQRGLPLAYLVTAGNQAQTDAATIAHTLLRDERVSAVGFYLEGFGDIRSLERMAGLARAVGKPVVVLKSGTSSAAQHAALSHTASLASSAATSAALLERLGITQVANLDVLLETLKILHFAGPLRNNSLTSVSCSGGEAALMADACHDLAVQFCEFSPRQQQELADCLGPRVNIANPLDYHTYIWGDVSAMTRCFSAVCAGPAGLNIFVYDLPRADRCDPSAWGCVIESLAATRQATSAPIAVLASLTDNMHEALAAELVAIGCVPLGGMRTALLAVDAAAHAGELLQRGSTAAVPLLVLPAPLPAHADKTGSSPSEHQAKLALALHGVQIPAWTTAADTAELRHKAANLAYPCVLKAQGLAHKSEQGGVCLNITDSEQLQRTAEDMAARLGKAANGFLVESMIDHTIAELLVGITRDAGGLLVLTLGFGGTLTELMKDSVTLLLPSSRSDISAALHKLKLYPVLEGYRGGPGVDADAMLDAIQAICAYAEDNAARLLELEVNPLLLRRGDAIAADALLRWSGASA